MTAKLALEDLESINALTEQGMAILASEDGKKILVNHHYLQSRKTTVSRGLLGGRQTSEYNPHRKGGEALLTEPKHYKLRKS